MKKLKLKFSGRNGFMLFAEWLQYALGSIEQNVENILQLRLLRQILGDFYEKKLVHKLMHQQEKYSLVFNDAQAVAIAIALHNHRDEDTAVAENAILDGILAEITQHLTKQPARINFPVLPTQTL